MWNCDPEGSARVARRLICSHSGKTSFQHLLGKHIIQFRSPPPKKHLHWHHMKVIISLSERVVVLNYGKKLAEGSLSDIGSKQEAIEAYLGEEYFV